MRRIGGIVAAGAVCLVAAGCAPSLMGIGMSYHPACSPMQVSAYRATSIMQTKDRINAIAAAHSYSRFATTSAEPWKGLSSGECR